MVATIDSRVESGGKQRISATRAGKRARRWMDKIDQRYLARIIDEGRMTKRDEAILEWLVAVRCATAEQIGRAFFSGVATGKNRLTKLYRMRMVERAYFPPEDAELLGVSPYTLVYYLGRGGKFWLQEIVGRRVAGSWQVLSPHRVGHDLMSTELVVALQEELRRLDEQIGSVMNLRLESEVPFWRLDERGEPEVRRVKRNDGKVVAERVALLRSDMRLEVRVGEGEGGPVLLSAFVEADMGNMTGSQFAEKVALYNEAAAMWRRRETRKGEGRAFPVVLVVTTGAIRARNLARVIGEAVDEGILWAVIDWERLRSVERLLVDPVWWKVVKGQVVSERPLLPSLAKKLGVME
ncbi:MAG: hypothetical protein D6706_21630 [Chloroflexi bacterium]|nr:MAG: hypothetical protein D6706_21630 [Chloroflexota bacterium]